MRSTRYALLLFGAGAVLGLLLVSAKLPGLGIVASALMAASLLFLPFALAADWWSHRPWLKPPPKRKVRTLSSPSPNSSAGPKSSPPRKRRSRSK